MDLARKRVPYRARRFTRPDEQIVLHAKILPQRYVEEWNRRLGFGVVIRIFDDPNDLQPTILGLEPLADWILSGPVFCRHRFVDNCQSRRVLVVGARKLAAGNNRDSK